MPAVTITLYKDVGNKDNIKMKKHILFHTYIITLCISK
jgi:hypothetical protein